MAYIQKNTPPPNRINNFSLVNFVGGLNNRSKVIEENQCSNVLNMIYSDDTVMERRRGSTIVDNLALTGDVTFIDEFKPYNESDVMMRGTNAELFYGNTKIANVGGQISGTNHMGKYFFADGLSIRVWGKFPQATTTYEKVVGTPDPNNVLLTVNNPPAYTPLTSEHTRGVTVYDYTNKTVHYEPCQNELDDSYKKTNVIPENPKYIVVRKGRMYVSGSKKDDDNVFITDVQSPYYFPVSLPIQMPPNSDAVVGLHLFDDSVVVGRNDDIHAISGDTNNPNLGARMFRLEKLNTHTGFANHYGVVNAHNYLLFLGGDGNAYALSSTQGGDRVLATTIITKNVNFFSPPVNLAFNDIYTASSCFFDDKWYVTMKDKVMIYSYRHQSWTMYNNLNARSFYKFNNTLIWGNSSGQTCMPSEDYLDQGVPYESFWSSKNFDMDEPSTFKQFREFFLVAHTFNDFKSDVRVTFEIDYVDVSDRVIIANQMSIWGTSIFGDRFINRNINASLPFVLGRRGRTIKFTFTTGYAKQGEVATKADLDGFVGKKEGSLVLVTGESTYYLFYDGVWTPMTTDDLNQAMRVYQVNGDYEYRGKR